MLPLKPAKFAFVKDSAGAQAPPAPVRFSSGFLLMATPLVLAPYSRRQGVHPSGGFLAGRIATIIIAIITTTG